MGRVNVPACLLAVVVAAGVMLAEVAGVPEAPQPREADAAVSSASLGQVVSKELGRAGRRLAERSEVREETPVIASEIVCWGDSMTEGVGAGPAVIERADGTVFDASDLSYPEVLERLTGISTCNFGVAGATSEEIAIMQGALEPSRPLDDYQTIDVGVMERGRDHVGGVLIMEMGSNGGWDGNLDVLIDQYRAMILHSSCTGYLVIGDTDDPGTSIADLAQRPFAPGTGAGETAWEAALSEAFGAHFINMRAYLVERGLEVAGLAPADEDLVAAARGCVSEQLRSDWTHLNSYGYYAQAVAVYERGAALGYWP